MHVVDSLEFGGMENGVVNIANYIDKDKFKFSICCLSHPGKLSGRIKDDDVSIISLGLSGGFRPKLFFQLANIFYKQKVDVVHTHGWQTLIYSSIAAFIARVPVLINGEHGKFHLDEPRRRVAYKIISKMVDRYITVSHSLKLELMSLLDGDKDRITIIPNGVDLKKFSSLSADEVSKCKSKLGIPINALVIGSVGRLEPVKNYQMLLSAFANLSRDEAFLHCVLIGDGILRRDLENLAFQLGVSEKVHFTGIIDNPHNIVPIFDVFVMTSINEGMSNAILEGMACGKAIVATDVGDNGKLVEDGVNGFLVKSMDAPALESSIKLLLTDKGLRQSAGNRSRSIVAEQFDIKKMVTSYQDNYLQAIIEIRG